ncbi:MAG: 4-hydroxy-tetrahydrodipicolinate synthase [Tannerella sp.]|jgi:4-hydroxy-tetrahydrodipicolinate synthase|nr:4-hydroxy-tetrahydrodipicolinate synthase [Tannerella sp.]
MNGIDLRGMGVALITPFKTDESVDLETLSKVVEFQVQNGVDYIVVLGTTAETSTLTEGEKSAITKTVVAQVRGRLPIVLGVSNNCTRALVKQLKDGEYQGIDVIMSVVPYYNKPTQEGLYQHFKAVAEASPLPVLMYNVPSRTGVNMTAQTTLRIAREFEQVIAIKEASGIFAQVDEIVKNKPDHFKVISGDDAITLPLIALGASGVISVIGNALPDQFSRMVHLALNSDYENARIIHAGLLELFELLFVDGSPAGIKSMLNIMGLIENIVRLPLVPARTATYERIREILKPD